MTSHPGEEQNPYFAPDGKHIAFTASYDGNVDAYVIGAEGGEPTRLTWHPGDDVVRGFTPEARCSSARRERHSRAGLRSSIRSVSTAEFLERCRCRPPIWGPSRPMGNSWLTRRWAKGSASGRTTVGEQPRESGSSSLMTCRMKRFPSRPAGATTPSRCGSARPSIFSRIATANSISIRMIVIQRKSLAAASTMRFPVASASSGAGKVIYEQAGWIHLYDPGEGKSRRLKIRVAADVLETRPRYATGSKHVRNTDLSPSGKRAVLEYRGEIVTVPAKKGDARNLTQTPGAHERSPVWSPDGKSIAYFSDVSGEYVLMVRPQDGKGDARSYPLKGAGFYDRPAWSPDSKKIAYIDNARDPLLDRPRHGRRQTDRR